jgi:hypothetical protein
VQPLCYSVVFFSGTVLYALAAGAPDWPSVVDRFGWWMTAHGVVMVLGGVAFGAAVVRQRAAPPWTGMLLALGVLVVASASRESNLVRTVAAALPCTALAGMGVDLLLWRPRPSLLRGSHSRLRWTLPSGGRSKGGPTRSRGPRRSIDTPTP